MSDKKQMKYNTRTHIYTGHGYVMKREDCGRWVIRDEDGNFISADQHRFDLAERYSLSLIGSYE